jgi:hypothetical protein
MPFTDSDGLVKVIERLEALHPSQINGRAAAEGRCARHSSLSQAVRSSTGPVADDAALGAIEEACTLMRQAAAPAAAQADAGTNRSPPP